VDAGDPHRAAGIDQRFSSLAAHVLEGGYYECPWQLFRIGHFKGLEDEPAAREVVAWARRQRINVMFEVRKVRDLDVLYLLLKAST
jgi:hypothetical protein